MFTATLLGDTKNIELRRRMINVQFTNGTTTLNKEFQFGILAEVSEMKKVVNQYLNELNTVVPEVTDLTVTPDVVVPPTQAELDKQAWDKDRANLKVLTELVRDGAVLKPAVLTALEALKTKVGDGFKAGYLG